MSPDEKGSQEAEVWRVNDEMAKLLKSIDENVYKGVRLLAALVEVLSRYEQDVDDTDLVPRHLHGPNPDDPLYAVADLMRSLLSQDQ